jgi:hypothetical protein
MSDHNNSNGGSDNEQEAPVTPTMERALAIVDSLASEERSNETPLPIEASITSPTDTSITSPSVTPVSTTQTRSAFVWPQPRSRPARATETPDRGIRRTPAGIRALSVATQSSMCTLQSDATTRIPANTSPGESAAESPRETPMIDQRPGGGFFGADALRPKSRKMKWTTENDRQLLLFGFGRDISRGEYQAIADSFKEKPTAKAVEERLTKLRAAGRKVLKESGIFDANAQRDMSTAAQMPAPRGMSAASPVAQTATPSQQKSGRKRPRKSDAPAVSEATETMPGCDLSDNTAFQPPSQGTLERLDATSIFTHGTDPLSRQLSQPPTFPSQSSMQMGQQQSLTMSFPPYQTASPNAGLEDYMGMSRFMALASQTDMSPTSYLSAGRLLGAGHGPQVLPPPMLWSQQQQSPSLYHGQQYSSPAMTGPPHEHGGNTTASADASMGQMAGENSDDNEAEEADA